MILKRNHVQLSQAGMQERERGRSSAAAHYAQRAAETERHAGVLRQILMSLTE